MLNKILENFERSINKLEEVLRLEKTEISRDSAIKRFELCFDLSWKAIKEYARISGIECYSPRECFKTALQLKLIEHNEKWLEMIDDRNLTVHLYKEELSEEIYQKLPEYLEMFKDLLERLKSKSE